MAIYDDRALAWRVRIWGIYAIYSAATRAKAKYYAAQDCSDAGFGSLQECLLSAKAKRAPEHDKAAQDTVSAPGIRGLSGYMLLVGHMHVGQF